MEEVAKHFIRKRIFDVGKMDIGIQSLSNIDVKDDTLFVDIHTDYDMNMFKKRLEECFRHGYKSCIWPNGIDKTFFGFICSNDFQSDNEGFVYNISFNLSVRKK